jgi:hypothetical protein
VSQYDDRIREALDARARRVQVEPEPADLTDRISRRERRRTRALSAALVLALFAGPTLGFIAARGETGGDRDMAADDEGRDGVTLGAGGALPTLRPNSGGFLGAPSADETDVFAATSAPVTAIERSEAGLWFGGITDQPLTRVFTRDHNGTKIRVFRAAVAPPTGIGPPWWTPPGYCFPNGVVQADVSNDDMVGIAFGSTFAELRDNLVGGALSIVGTSEGAPKWIVIAQAPAGAKKVRASFPGGATDEVEPIDGVAVLIGDAQVAPDDYEEMYQSQAQLEAFDGAGASLGAGTANFGGMGAYASEDAGGSACMAPQTLPPPGEEQPADVAAARQAVEAAFLLAHGAHDESQEQMMSAIDDPTNFPEYWNELTNGTFKEQVAAAVIGIDEVVFMSATRAAVRYHWDVPGYGTSFHNRFGEMVFVDGAWKVTRASMCQDFALAGTICE